jgi:lipooligosaccharide transport system permease protein
MWKWRRAIISYGLGNPVLYLTSIGLGLGSIVDARQSGGIDGVPYLVFLAPALLASAALMGGIEETTWPTFEGFVWGKQFRAIFASPITGRQIALGVVWVSVLRGSELAWCLGPQCTVLVCGRGIQRDDAGGHRAGAQR